MKILLIILLASLQMSTAQGQGLKHVAIVASYEQGHICGEPQDIGVIEGLAHMDWSEMGNLKIHRFYMDSKRKNTSKVAQKAVALEILSVIEKSQIQIVITLDDNAFREVGLPLVGKEGISVVFSGLNGQPENYNKLVNCIDSRAKPGHNVTGIYEKLYVVKSLQVMLNSIQGLRGNKVIGITDYSPTGNAITRQFELEMAKESVDVKWELHRVKNWAEYKELISKINLDSTVKAIYPVALSLKVSDEITYTAPEIFKWTVEHSKKPEMALNYFFSKIGLFGGAAVDFKSMGFAVGQKAAAILNGAVAGELSIDDAPDYAIVFNHKRAQKLGINIPVALLTAAHKVYK